MIDATLVAIHGFWSSSATWERLNTIWSADGELRGLRIDPFSYPSPKKPRFPLSTTRVPDYDDIAQSFANRYEVHYGDASAVVIVTHSQGGLILQRFLVRMLNAGRGQELSRIRTIVMLVCPNGGSEYVRSLRHVLGYGRHAQAGNLEVLDKQVIDTQRTVLQRIVYATGVDEHQCCIPFHVYAGDSDKIVTAASAQGAFPEAGVLPGNHFSILDPSAPGNSTATTIRHHILADLATDATPAAGQARPLTDAAPDRTSSPSAAERGEAAEKYRIDIRDSEGLVIGDHAHVTQSVGEPSPRSGQPTAEEEEEEEGDAG